MYSKNQFWNDLKAGKFESMVKDSAKGQMVHNAEEVYHIVKPLTLKHKDVEVVYGIFLDSKNQILAIEKMFSGTINVAHIYPREIVKKMIEHQATALIMAHNHPSGVATPSADDRRITEKVSAALQSIDATLHDHIIVGNGYFSLADCD